MVTTPSWLTTESSGPVRANELGSEAKVIVGSAAVMSTEHRSVDRSGWAVVGRGRGGHGIDELAVAGDGFVDGDGVGDGGTGTDGEIAGPGEVGRDVAEVARVGGRVGTVGGVVEEPRPGSR